MRPTGSQQRAGWLWPSLLLVMIRVFGRRNGTEEPTVLLRVDREGDAAMARTALVDEAAQRLIVQPTVANEQDWMRSDDAVR